MSSFNFIRGDTFSRIAEYKGNNKKLMDLTDVTITAEVSNADGTFSETLDIQKLDQSSDKGKFIFSSSTSDTWPIETLNLKISKTIGGVQSSVTCQVIVKGG